MATGTPAAPPEPALPPGPDAPAPELHGGAVGLPGAPPPPWLERGAAAGAMLRAVSLARALWVMEPSSAGNVHAGLLRLVDASEWLLRAVAGASAAGRAEKPVAGAASGCANVAAVAAWRWSSDDDAATGAAEKPDGAKALADEDGVAEVVGAVDATGVSERAA